MSTFSLILSSKLNFFFLHQWKHGDPEPSSWAEHYRMNPCVPVDYRSVHTAVALATAGNHHPRGHTLQNRTIHVLLRPGKYYLREAITVQSTVGVKISIETMEMPENIFQPTRPTEVVEQPPEAPALPKRSHSFSRFMRCNRPNYDVEETERSESSDYSEADWMGLIPQPPTHATLILRSRRPNEPAFRVRQGSLVLKNVEIQHNSHGIDIWNGNAAVQIQPPLSSDDIPVVVNPRPSAMLERVKILSQSGRGVVNIDGGKVVIRNSAVIDCAATGVYIGGPGSQALVEHTDVLRNGVGNRSRRGIARGHSGIYLEQGFARIVDCAISGNTLTGISAVSPENAVLNLENCDLMSNGTYQLEMPPPGTNARRRSITNNNNMSVIGVARLRSGLMTESRIDSLLG